MNNYQLQNNEVVLYKYDGVSIGGYNESFGSTSYEILLTNINFVIMVTTRKMFSKEESFVTVHSMNQIKIYNDEPQIKVNKIDGDDCNVELYFTDGEEIISFDSAKEAKKFQNAVYELITGRSSDERCMKKVKGKVDLVDKTFGIDTIGGTKKFVSSVAENGIKGMIKQSLFGNTNNERDALLREGTSVVSSLKDRIINKKSIQSVELEPLNNNTESYDDKIEHVKKLKELLDCGIISQEEFDKKKKELLGL